MALTDYDFLGTAIQNANQNLGATYVAYQIADANGDNTNPGYAAMGIPQAHSALASGLPTGSVHQTGTYCRKFPFSSDTGTDSSNASSWVGLAALKPAAGGSLYPVTQTPAQGTFVSFSLRSFMRVSKDGNDNQTEWVGGGVGMAVKTVDDTDGTGTAPGLDAESGQVSGYCVELGYTRKRSEASFSTRRYGINNFQSNNGPRLVISLNSQVLYSTNNDHRRLVCTGTYDWDTWYHVRMDVIPRMGADDIIVYTAPVSGGGSAHVAGLGSETWTQVGKYTVYASDRGYVPWGLANQDRVGYYFAGNEYDSATDFRVDSFIDKFQFLSKDISS